MNLRSRKLPSIQCLYIRQNAKERQISLTNFGNPTKPLQNFIRACRFVIQKIKREIKKETISSGLDWRYFELWHQKGFKALVMEFIENNQLNENIQSYITPNGSGNNVVEFTNGVIKEKFIEFYKEKVKSDPDLHFLKMCRD